MLKKTVEIDITGIVQGVGFRPFLFNLARNLDLKGYILNRGNAGIRLVLQGDSNNIENFIKDIEVKKPEISYIEDIKARKLDSDTTYSHLEIKSSEQGRGISLTLPPDISICENCLKDMRNKNLSNYYQYPFIACAVCGPRYTTVKALPYDRERSTMIKFPFCDYCSKEYSDFDNRRFHAQTFACSLCGPNYKLYNKSKEEIKKNSIKEIIEETANRIKNGEVAAVKGIGGVHLVCMANNDDTILRLRKRKGKRKNKPFALMVPNVEVIDNYLKISTKEREILTSYRKPIVLLEKIDAFKDSNISELIAPGLNNIGIMLPYTGIHYLIFDSIGEKPLVYTSGNPSNIPMGIDNDKIFEQLQDLADIFLLHDRPIYQRADDSVLRIHDDKTKLIRRSRGYVPEYLPLPFEVDIPGALATGPELALTGAVLRRNRIFPTQHIGNVTHLETHEFLKDALFHMKNLLQIDDSELKFAACDAHPAFITTKYAKELSFQYNMPLYPIQHHHAHVLGLMAEKKVAREEKIVGIAVDGVGYGEDGNVWGGEILLSSYNGYERLGHLEYQPMIGGDRCTKYPARMVASIFLNSLDIEGAKNIFSKLNIEKDLEYKETEISTIISQFERYNKIFPSENIPLTSSTGRIFDSISYLLGASSIKTYRGEPAMKLEGLALKGNAKNISLDIDYSNIDGTYIINTSKLLQDVVNLREDPENKREDIAAKFQEELGRTFAEVAIKVALNNNVNKIGLTGGVAYNYSFSRAIKNQISQVGLDFLEHDLIPPGDAGISIGQLIGALFHYQCENI